MRKASFESLHTANGSSFLVRSFQEKAFSAPYHFHPELELTLILKGEGKRFVGSDMSAYGSGDLVLLGPNLPHCWKSENVKKGAVNASSLVIQFTHDFMGPEFFFKPEMAGIRQLLQKSRYGIRFLTPTATEIKEALLSLQAEEKPFAKLLLFLEILQRLSSSKRYRLLDKQHHSFTHSPSEQKRINDVLAYVVENFSKKILLEEAAGIAGMTPTAFCKFFKRLTRKTFMDTVMDYRINHATQQLVQTDKPVADVAFESGFGDASHFFKKFKSHKQQSPLAYRKSFAKEID